MTLTDAIIQWKTDPRDIWFIVMLVVFVILAIKISKTIKARATRAQFPPKPCSIESAEVNMPNYAVVQVFYATDRNQTSSLKPEFKYGVDRGAVCYGTCDVSIPRDHRMGEIESPSVMKLEFRKDPEKHVVLLSVVPLDSTNFYSQLQSRISASHGKNAFIFIHGYNVTFEDAARRTAQMQYDLGFDGAPVFYSWPSQGSLMGYPVDESNIEWTQTNLQRFLADFVNQTGAENVYLIAHSMGNRALTRAFAAVVGQMPAIRRKFRALILAAPDIDAEVFKRDIAPQIVTSNPLVTLYASTTDKALLASKEFHGYPRLGDAGIGLVVLSGMDTIDATSVDSSLLGHSYFAENRSVLSDIFYLIRDAKPVAQQLRFGLEPAGTPPGQYYKFKQ
jgi:esterase/lipase superfamily enzyme